jgi:hypothetical protein
MSLLAVQGGATGTGTVTLLAPVTNTNRTLTLPDATGTVLSSATTTGFPAGSVLQVVSANLSVEQSTTSSSFVTTTLAASITPSSLSSKVYIIVNGNLDCDSSQTAIATIFRSATNLGNGNNGLGSVFASPSPSTRVVASIGMSFLDSPSTTSATTYTVFYRASNAATIRWAQGSATSTITLMEIAA